MRIFFSGSGGTTSPEYLIPQRKPNVMPTFHQLHVYPHWVGWAGDRLRRHLKRKQVLTDLEIDKLFAFLKKHREKETNEHQKRKTAKQPNHDKSRAVAP